MVFTRSQSSTLARGLTSDQPKFTNPFTGKRAILRTVKRAKIKWFNANDRNTPLSIRTKFGRTNQNLVRSKIYNVTEQYRNMWGIDDPISLAEAVTAAAHDFHAKLPNNLKTNSRITLQYSFKQSNDIIDKQKTIKKDKHKEILNEKQGSI